jgi:hypothetical protein
LLSYKDEKNWAVLIKGSSVIMVTGKSTLRVLEEFEEWKDRLDNEEFESVLKDCYKHFEPVDLICHHIKVPYNTGKMPETHKMLPL